MEALLRGGMVARLAAGPEDFRRITALRDQAFPGAAGEDDPLDALCQHLLVADAAGGILATARFCLLDHGAALASDSYAARFYDLSPMAHLPGPLLELGRFAVAPGPQGWAALRLAWVALTRLVDGQGARMLLGCASFSGADWRQHRAGLALLSRGHLGPAALRPKPRSATVLDYPALTHADSPDHAAALAALPPLLRSYLGMGAWVSDHAVADLQLDTLHVFTCLPVAQIPKARKASLRALVAD